MSYETALLHFYKGEPSLTKQLYPIEQDISKYKQQYFLCGIIFKPRYETLFVNLTAEYNKKNLKKIAIKKLPHDKSDIHYLNYKQNLSNPEHIEQLIREKKLIRYMLKIALYT